MRIKNQESRIKGSLIVKDLRAGIGGKEILKGLNLTVRPGEVHALMGPNGSGKSTLSNVLAGHPHYAVRSGRVTFGGKNILRLPPDERAKLGLFLAFQYPLEITGVGFFNLLKTSYTAVHGQVDFKEFSEKVSQEAQKLHLDKSFLTRAVNEGFSGGEKKKAEILQMTILRPKLVILDETDSGLDIDALRVVAEAVNNFKTGKIPDPDPPAGGRRAGSGIFEAPGVLLITHYLRILKYIKPDFVHVLIDGKIAAEGGSELATKLEKHGYEWVTKK